MKRTLILVLTAMVLFTACTQPPPSTPEPTQPSTSQTTSISQTSTSQPDTKTLSMEEYLKDNAISATEENMAEMFKLIDTEQYDIYFTGEAHGMRNTYIFKFELLKYLHQNAGVRYFIEEGGYGAIEYLNLYFETGDENILDSYLKDTLFLTSAYSNECFDFYKKIYEFNQTVPKEDRIRPIGLDVDQVFATPIRYLQTILPDKIAPKEIETTIIQLKAYDEIPTFSNSSVSEVTDFYKQISETLVANFNQNKDGYKEFLGEKFGTYAFIINNLEKTYEAYLFKVENKKNEYFTMREEQIYQNFKAIYPTLHTKKIYGHWGGGHIRLIKGTVGMPADITPFTLRAIQANDISKEKICTIDLIAFDSFAAMPSLDYEASAAKSKGVLLLEEEKLIRKLIPDDYGLVKLDSIGSPFTTGKAWMRDPIQCVPSDVVTADLYSYVYILKNSPAATKYTPKK